jgi:pimeloyl-ACP methyl ester carboxylesterase
MKDPSSHPGPSALDRPDISACVFHPRPEYPDLLIDTSYQEVRIPVDRDTVVGGRFYPAGKQDPVLVFFHGNGEIVADYHDLSPVLRQLNLNFFPVDYRGYGKSTGEPCVSNMLGDAVSVWRFAGTWLAENGFTGARCVMGRSLGSASALALASAFPDEVKALVIESGFAFTLPLLQRLGVDVQDLEEKEEHVVDTLRKIRSYPGPTLIIHGEADHIIPVSDARALHQASSAEQKNLLVVPGAHHNNLLAVGFEEYFKALQTLIGRLDRKDS